MQQKTPSEAWKARLFLPGDDIDLWVSGAVLAFDCKYLKDQNIEGCAGQLAGALGPLPLHSNFPPCMSLPVLHPLLATGVKSSLLAQPERSALSSGGVSLGTVLVNVLCSSKEG